MTVDAAQFFKIRFKSRPPDAQQFLFPREVCILTRKQDGNKIGNVIWMNVCIKEKVDVTVSDANIQHPPQCPGATVNQ